LLLSTGCCTTSVHAFQSMQHGCLSISLAVPQSSLCILLAQALSHSIRRMFHGRLKDSVEF